MAGYILWGVLLLVWIYVLNVFKKEKLTAFHFLTGSIGVFCFTMTMFKTYLALVCTNVLEFLLTLCSKILPYFEIYKKYNIIFITHNSEAISLFIDYECCGFIEILVVISVIAFFPLFKVKEKIFYSIIGYIYTTIANLIRLLVVVAFIYRYGNNAYYIAHSVVGRIIFYILTLLFYFYMITWKQIKNQKVGSFGYDDDKRVTKGKVKPKEEKETIDLKDEAKKE